MTNTEAIETLNEVKAGLSQLTHLFDEPLTKREIMRVQTPPVFPVDELTKWGRIK